MATRNYANDWRCGVAAAGPARGRTFRRQGHCGNRAAAWQVPLMQTAIIGSHVMNTIIYIVGLVVVVGFVLSLLGIA